MRKTTFTATALIVALAGCGSSSTAEPTRDQASSTTEETPDVVLTIERPDDHSDVHSKRVRLGGTVDPPTATVEVAGRDAIVRDGRWQKTVTWLERGSNKLIVTASAPGHALDTADVTVIRRRTQAEIAAAREARRLRAQRREASFRASARRIDYDQLLKDPERFSGEKVVYTGKILQVREEGGSGFMLLQVTCDEYGFCDDPIYVEYEDSTDSAEDDEVTVYGIVRGGYEYDTQAGGSNFVPSVEARYIDE